MGKIKRIGIYVCFFIVVFFLSFYKVDAFSPALDTINLENGTMENIQEGKYEYDVFLDQEQVTTNNYLYNKLR